MTCGRHRSAESRLLSPPPREGWDDLRLEAETAIFFSRLRVMSWTIQLGVKTLAPAFSSRPKQIGAIRAKCLPRTWIPLFWKMTWFFLMNPISWVNMARQERGSRKLQRLFVSKEHDMCFLRRLSLELKSRTLVKQRIRTVVIQIWEVTRERVS